MGQISQEDDENKAYRALLQWEVLDMRRIKYWKWKWTSAINISWFNNIKWMGWNRIIH